MAKMRKASRSFGLEQPAKSLSLTVLIRVTTKLFFLLLNFRIEHFKSVVAMLSRFIPFQLTFQKLKYEVEDSGSVPFHANANHYLGSKYHETVPLLTLRLVVVVQDPLTTTTPPPVADAPPLQADPPSATSPPQADPPHTG